MTKRCDHIKAVMDGVIMGARLRDGDWLYELPYHCPDCGARFTEMHRQRAPRDTLSARIDAALGEVRELRAMVSPHDAAGGS